MVPQFKIALSIDYWRKTNKFYWGWTIGTNQSFVEKGCFRKRLLSSNSENCRGVVTYNSIWLRGSIVSRLGNQIWNGSPALGWSLLGTALMSISQGCESKRVTRNVTAKGMKKKESLCHLWENAHTERELFWWQKRFSVFWQEFCFTAVQ